MFEKMGVSTSFPGSLLFLFQGTKRGEALGTRLREFEIVVNYPTTSPMGIWGRFHKAVLSQR